jgi:hypothetical protein
VYLMEFYGKLKRGQLGIINMTEVTRMLSTKPDCPLVKIVLIPQEGRSQSKNRYLHCLLIPEFRQAFRSCGYDIRTDAQAKTLMKEMFLKQSVYDPIKQDYEDVIRDTSSLTEIEMKNLIADVIRWVAQNIGYQIKFPGEEEYGNS